MEYELYHHGVKGMKWGVRKARKAYDTVLDRKRKKSKRDYVSGRINDATNPKGSPSDQFKKTKKARHEYGRNDAKLAWKQAKNKAKMDPEYKNSDEYKEIKRKNAIAVTEDVLRDLGSTQTKRL